MHAMAVLSSTAPPYVSQLPRLIALTRTPARPNRRYSMLLCLLRRCYVPHARCRRAARPRLRAIARSRGRLVHCAGVALHRYRVGFMGFPSARLDEGCDDRATERRQVIGHPRRHEVPIAHHLRVDVLRTRVNHIEARAGEAHEA